MSGDTLSAIFYALLVLAVPFLFGVAAGRGIRRPAETFQHRFGSRIICALEDVRTTRKIVGEGMVIENTLLIQFPDRRDIKITVGSAS